MTECPPDADLGRSLDHRDRHHVGDSEASDDDGEKSHRHDDQLELAVAFGGQLQGLALDLRRDLRGSSESDGDRQRLGCQIFRTGLASDVQLVGLDRILVEKVVGDGRERYEHRIVESGFERNPLEDTHHRERKSAQFDRSVLPGKIREFTGQGLTDDRDAGSTAFVEVVEPTTRHQSDLEYFWKGPIGGQYRNRDGVELLERLRVGSDEDVRQLTDRTHRFDGRDVESTFDGIDREGRRTLSEGTRRRRLDEVGPQFGDLGFQVAFGRVGQTHCGDDGGDTDHRSEEQ